MSFEARPKRKHFDREALLLAAKKHGKTFRFRPSSKTWGFFLVPPTKPTRLRKRVLFVCYHGGGHSAIAAQKFVSLALSEKFPVWLSIGLTGISLGRHFVNAVRQADFIVLTAPTADLSAVQRVEKIRSAKPLPKSALIISNAVQLDFGAEEIIRKIKKEIEQELEKK